MRRSPTLEEKRNDVERIKTRLGSTRLLLREYLDAGGEFSRSQLYSDGHTLETVGLAPDEANAPVADEVYLDRLKRFIEREGRLPKSSEKRRAGLNFGSGRWASLGVFLEHAAKEGVFPRALLTRRGPILPAFPVLSGQSPMAMGTEPTVAAHERELPPIPKKSKWKKWSRIDEPGFPYEPHDELGVVALFAILCSHGKLPYQLVGATGGQGTDSVCWDEKNRKHLNIEFKYVLSKTTWNHPLDDVDVVVCWRSTWPNFPKEVLELSHRYQHGT